MERIITLMFALFILLNEIILAFDSEIGAFMYLVMMSMALILLSRQEGLNDAGQMIVIFLIVPLVRIAGLFIDMIYIWKMVLGYGILLFLGVYYLYKFNIDIGETWKYLWMLPIVIFLGVVVGFFSNSIFATNGSLVLIMLLPLIVFSEEIFFRGLMQNVIERSCGIFYSIIIPAIVYGALSLYLGAGLAILLFFVSIFSGLLYSYTKNIFLSIAFNLIVFAFAFVIPNLI